MNEYQEEFERLQQKDTFRGQQWFGERQRLVEEYAWAVPNDEAIQYIAEFDNIVEVAAGSGYWAHLIDDAGGTIRATDFDPPDDTYYPVERKSASNVNTSFGRVDTSVLLVWPPHTGNVASSVITKNPNNVLYVGEQRGGCTAEDAFFDTLDERYTLIKVIDIPSYEGINDNLYHYARKI